MAQNVIVKLGERVRELREQREFTQEALADRAGVTRHFISHIERGTKGATVGTLLNICGVLEVSLSELFLDVDRAAPDELATLSAAIAGQSPETQGAIFRVVKEVLGIARSRSSR